MHQSTTAGDQPPPRPACTFWIGPERRYCAATDSTRRYVNGYRCPLHTPRALQGLPELPPPPGWPIHRKQDGAQ